MNDLNFFDKNTYKQKRGINKYVIYFVIVIILNLIFVSYNKYLSKQYREYKSDLMDIMNEGYSKEVDLRLQEDLKIEEDFNQLYEANKNLEGVFVRREKSIRYIVDNILLLLPLDLELENIKVMGYHISIIGYSNNKDSIYDYYNRIKTLDYSDKVVLENMKNDGNDNYTFIIEFRIR